MAHFRPIELQYDLKKAQKFIITVEVKIAFTYQCSIFQINSNILLISGVKIPFQIRSKSLESRSWSHSRSHFQAEK